MGQPLPDNYKHYDLVFLQGSLSPFSDHILRINGSPLLTLSPRMFLVLTVLACHGRTLKGLPTPRPVVGPPYLTAAKILDVICDWRARDSLINQMFGSYEEAKVIKAVSSLRKVFASVGVPRDLISNGPSRIGMRLETPPCNVFIKLVE